MRIPALQISGILLLLLLSLFASAQKTDKVYLKNGDVVTGEIKYMKLAKLTFDMNGPGIIYIKWAEVTGVNSSKIFQITTQDGQVLISKLDSTFFDTYFLRIDDIVEIVTIKNKFLKRLSGDVNLGFNYAKSSDILQFNFGTSITYRVPKIESNFKISNAMSRASEDTITSKKQDATAGVLKTLENHYYVTSYLGWERNTELGLQNRYLLAGAGGKMILSDNSQRLLTGGGLSYSREQFSDTSDYTGNLEALAMVEFKKFRYSFPKINIDANFKLFPGLSDWGRIRVNFSLTTSFEIFKDFNVGLSFYDNFDNRPSTEARSKNDYGVSFTISYFFGK